MATLEYYDAQREALLANNTKDLTLFEFINNLAADNDLSTEEKFLLLTNESNNKSILRQTYYAKDRKAIDLALKILISAIDSNIDSTSIFQLLDNKKIVNQNNLICIAGSYRIFTSPLILISKLLDKNIPVQGLYNLLAEHTIQSSGTNFVGYLGNNASDDHDIDLFLSLMFRLRHKGVSLEDCEQGILKFFQAALSDNKNPKDLILKATKLLLILQKISWQQTNDGLSKKIDALEKSLTQDNKLQEQIIESIASEFDRFQKDNMGLREEIEILRQVTSFFETQSTNLSEFTVHLRALASQNDYLHQQLQYLSAQVNQLQNVITALTGQPTNMPNLLDLSQPTTHIPPVGNLSIFSPAQPSDQSHLKQPKPPF